MDKSLVISHQFSIQTRANRRSLFGHLIRKLRSKRLNGRKNCKFRKNREFHKGEDSEDAANSSDSLVKFCVVVGDDGRLIAIKVMLLLLLLLSRIG